MTNMAPSERIKEERERLGFSQTAFGALAEASKRTQIGWEQARSSPGLEALAAWAKAGADIQYIVTGARASAGLAAEEGELLALYRAAPLAVKMAAVGALQAGAAPAKSSRMNVTFGGENKGAVAETIIGAGVLNRGKKA